MNASAQIFFQKFIDRLPATAQLRLAGLTKIPLLLIANPRVLRLDSECSEIRLPLNYLTKNHLGSMYFGALSIGADSVIGLLALHIAKEFPEHRISIVFKNFNIDFHRRAMDHVTFRCEAAEQIRKMIQTAVESGERVTEPVPGQAFEVATSTEPVASFVLGLSLKVTKK